MLWWLIQNTLVAAVLAGVVAAVCRFARPSPAVRHALWLVVLIKLIAPPLVFWPWSASELWQPISQFLVADRSDNSIPLPQDPPVETDAPSPPVNSGEMQILLIPVTRDEPTQLVVDVPPAKLGDAPARAVVGEPTPETMPESAAGESGRSNSPASLRSNSMEGLVIRAWLVGAVAMGMWQVARIGQFRRRLAQGEVAPNGLTQQVHELSSRLRIRAPEITIVPLITSPLIWALGRARLIWPQGLLDHLPESSRQSVLLHELTHLRRRDHWVGWLQLLGACLCWWNPLFWYVSRQVRENAELACDAWVVATLPGGRRAYAEALIEVAQMMSQLEAPAPALTLGAGRRREFERRLIMIMCAGVPCKLSLRGLVVVGLLALAALPGWSPGQQEPAAPPQPTAPATVPPPPTPTAPVQPSQNDGTPVAVPTQVAPVTPAPAIAEIPPPAVVIPATPYSLATVDQNDSDARLKAIEQQLQALLKEVRGMHKVGPNIPGSPAVIRHVPARAGTHATPSPVQSVPVEPAIITAPALAGYSAPRATSSGSSPEINLTRHVYDLPAGKAKALADLLQDSKGPVVEIRAEGDKVTVTTTPEAQQIVGQLIAMLQGKARSPHSYFQIQNGIAVPVTSYPTAPAAYPIAPAAR